MNLDAVVERAQENIEADQVNPAAFVTIGPDGSITGLTIPVVFASACIQWVRQADGAVLGSLCQFNVGTAPNRQQQMILTSQEPVDAGANAYASVTTRVNVNTAGFTLQDRKLMELSSLFGVGNTLLSDWCLQENLIGGRVDGTVTFSAADKNYRIYNMTGNSAVFVSNNQPANFVDTTNGRINIPKTGLWLIAYHMETSAGSPGMSITATYNGAANAHNISAQEVVQTTGVSNGLSLFDIQHLASGATVQYGGWCSGGGTGQTSITAIRLPWDAFETP